MPAPDEISLYAGRFNAIGVEYMVTGATAAIVYGQPRLTNDLDVVLTLRGEQVRALIDAFPESEFYVPPEAVIQTERSRSLRGHFNILHVASGYKADIYLAGGSSKHPADIRAMLATTDVDLGAIETWVERLGLAHQWAEVRRSP